ncbi:MAG: hypothetical protein WCF03_14360 [Nitrososphaeraceae archaeon]
MPVLTPYGNKSIAFTVLKPSSGTPLPSRTLNFAASELSFHTLDGSKSAAGYRKVCNNNVCTCQVRYHFFVYEINVFF